MPPAFRQPCLLRTVLVVLRRQQQIRGSLQTRQRQGEDVASVPMCLFGVKKVEDPQRLLNMVHVRLILFYFCLRK